MTFALIGNQNSGKTTLFNQLTGSNQHVGNFPGVTVEKKEGVLKKNKDASIVDLPGIYSLSPYTSEEVVTRDFLLKGRPDCIINIIDATNIERNLYLTLQLIELEMPMVIALNMMDEVRANGNSIYVDKLSSELGVAVVPISASKNEGVDELAETAIKVARAKKPPQKLDFCSGDVHRAIHSVCHIIEDHAQRINVPVRFAATKLIEGDEPMLASLELSTNEIDIIGHVVDEMQTNLGTDREAALADMRYEYIENLCKICVKKVNSTTKEQIRSEKIDKVLTSKYFAIPIFLCIMVFGFWLTFGPVGGTLSNLFSLGIEKFTDMLDSVLTNAEVAPALKSLIIDGICSGVGSVLSFLPTIVVLFFFLSILEDTGYMARIAFVMDKLLRKIGLSGRSFVPMLIGFGCSVPAIMATRTLSSERDRKMTILLTPFISCSAKLPIYAIFTQVFFPNHAVLVMSSLYFGGILVGIITANILNRTKFKGKPIPFVMELPSYRFPSYKNVILHMWEKAKDFIVKAFTIIFMATIIIWFLQAFNYKFDFVSDTSESMLASIGKFLSPLFAPLGFSSWKSVTALITGLTAKEAVISTFRVLLESPATTFEAALQGEFSSIAAVISFLTFTLLYMPCVATMAAIKRELGSTLKSAQMMLWQTGIAWICAFVVYRIALLFV
ncbi:MAG: ferrous iron transport protein B [Clostridiales bacterium]|nr:ferrous iron transport protein B [Clostridiales bacterium]